MNTFKARRMAAGLTQEEAATELGVGRTTVTQWESGTNMPTAAKLPKIAALYRCNIGDLIEPDQPPETEAI